LLNDHTNWVKSIVYSPTGDQIVTGGEDETVRFWDATSGECLATMQTFNSSVESIAWSTTPDTNRFVVGSNDGSVNMWEVIENEGTCRVRPRWGSVKRELMVKGTSIQGVRGLSQINEELLKQRGAVGEPFVRLREATKKVIGMASVTSTLKKTPSKTVQDSASSFSPSTEQPEQQEGQKVDSTK
jgi:WD40 repeat protein